MDAVQNNPIVQDIKDAVQNGEDSMADSRSLHSQLTGPVVQKVQEQSAKMSSEFQDLADARRSPEKPAATSQPLTRKSNQTLRLNEKY
jgi:hypothetical protein